MVTLEQFLRDLHYGYAKLNPVPLKADYLTQLFTVFGKIFVVPANLEQYAQLLDTSIQSLSDFTKTIHPALLEQPATEAVFYSQHTPDELLNLEDPAPFRALAYPFRGKDFSWLYNAFEYSPIGRDTPPFLAYAESGTKEWDEERKENERRQKQYWKDYDKAFDQASPFLQALTGSPFYRFADRLLPTQLTLLPLNIPPHIWFEGTWIVAPPGRGKTNLLRHLVLNLLKRDASVILMDAKGDLIDSFRDLSLPGRTVLLEPSLEHPLAINPLQIGARSVDLLEYIFSALLETKLTPNQQTLFRMVLTLVTTIPNATIETFRDFLIDSKPYAQYINQLPLDEQAFFFKEYSTRTYQERKPEILLRLRLLMSNPYIKAMFRSAETKVDIGSLMDQGKLIIINNSYDPDMLGRQGSEFFARFFIALILAAAQRRARKKDAEKKPCYFIIDEAHIAIARDEEIATILDQCRSQKIALILAHQRIRQITSDNVLDALSNCAIRFANADEDAAALAPRLRTTPEFISEQPKLSFAVYVRELTKKAVSVPLTWVDMAAYRQATLEEQRDTAQRLLSYAQGSGTPPLAPLPPPPDDTLYWSITISPRVAQRGGQVSVQGFKVNIPPGTKDGAVLRLRGAGQQRKDKTRGDVYLTIHVPGLPQNRQVVPYGHDPDEIG